MLRLLSRAIVKQNDFYIRNALSEDRVDPFAQERRALMARDVNRNCWHQMQRPPGSDKKLKQFLKYSQCIGFSSLLPGQRQLSPGNLKLVSETELLPDEVMILP